jgi:hypothetical protein
MPSRLLECPKGNQLKTTRWDFHFRSPAGAAKHANFTDSQPANAPVLDNLFDPFIFGDVGQSAELRTS